MSRYSVIGTRMMVPFRCRSRSVGVGENQVAVGGDVQAPAGRHSRREERPLDDGRPVGLCPRLLVVEVVDTDVVYVLGVRTHRAHTGGYRVGGRCRAVADQYGVGQLRGDVEAQRNPMGTNVYRVAPAVRADRDGLAVWRLFCELPFGPAVGELVALLDHVPLGPHE